MHDAPTELLAHLPHTDGRIGELLRETRMSVGFVAILVPLENLVIRRRSRVRGRPGGAVHVDARRVWPSDLVRTGAEPVGK